MFRRVFFLLLLIVFSNTFCSAMLDNEPTIIMPDKVYLQSKFNDHNLTDFAKQTGIIKKLANKKLSGAGIAAILHQAFCSCLVDVPLWLEKVQEMEMEDRIIRLLYDILGNVPEVKEKYIEESEIDLDNL